MMERELFRLATLFSGVFAEQFGDLWTQLLDLLQIHLVCGRGIQAAVKPS